MQLDLVGGSYTQKYIDAGTKKSINWYPVMYGQQEQSKGQKAAYPTPGLSLFYNITGRYHRGGIVARTTKYVRCFVVVDNTLWEINSNFSVTSRGVMSNLPIGSSRIKLLCNGNQEVGIFGFNAGYVFNMDNNTLTQITDSNYPNTVVSAAYIDGYCHVVSGTGTTNPQPGYVVFSSPNSFLTWTVNALQQAFHPTFKAAATIGIVDFRDKLFCFSNETIEPYYEDGSTAIWARYPASIERTGALQANTISVYDKGIIYIGKSDNGESEVFMLNSEWATPQPISQLSQSVQWQINSKKDLLNDAFSFIQISKDGHELYYLTVPSLKTTFVFDVVTNQWHERQSINPNPDCDGQSKRDIFRGIYCLNFSGYNLFADYYSGAIFYEDYTNQTENGTYIRREITSATYNQEYKNISVSPFEIDATKGVGTLSGQGSNPILMLETSITGGRTFSQPRNIILNNYGDYLYRTRINKLGTGRNWCLRLILTDPLDLMIQNAYANGSVGQY